MDAYATWLEQQREAKSCPPKPTAETALLREKMERRESNPRKIPANSVRTP